MKNPAQNGYSVAALAQEVDRRAAPLDRFCVSLEERVVTVHSEELDKEFNFSKLDDDATTSILETRAPDLTAWERQRIIAMSFGSAGRALAFAELELAKLEDAAVAILRQGDPTNARRSDLASELGKKGAGERYAAFLELAPSLIAREARRLDGAPRERALEAYTKARELAGLAPRLSLDPAATVFQIGGMLAEVAPPASLKR